MIVDKSKLRDVNGNPMTQGLFLEIGYNTDLAIFSLKDYDHTYKDVLYPSLKKLYLEEEDPTEYIFAEKYLLGWQHWKRMNDNAILSRHFQTWREELEIKLRAMAVRALRDMCQSENGNFQASKFLADRGWDKNKIGRPSKEELAKRERIGEKVDNEFKADIKRLEDYR